MRASVGTATDSVFVTALIAGTTPIGSTGSGIDNVAADLKALLGAVSVDSNSRLHLIVGPAVAAQLAVLASTTGVAFPTAAASGGSIAGIPVHTSDALTDEVVLVDAQALAMASDQIRLRVSTQAALEMDTTPSNTPSGGSPEVVEGNLVSMWQTDATALLAERYFGFAIARASGVASLSSVTWGSGGSP